MKKDNVKWAVIIGLSLFTVILLIMNAVKDITGFWNVNISQGIEVLILIFVSYYLVERQNEVDKKKAKIDSVITKIQARIMAPDLIRVDTDENKKVTRIKLKSISNLIQIVTESLEDTNDIELIVSEMDNLVSMIMDHIDDSEYIEKSGSQIIRLVTNVDTLLEKIKFNNN